MTRTTLNGYKLTIWAGTAVRQQVSEFSQRAPFLSGYDETFPPAFEEEIVFLTGGTNHPAAPVFDIMASTMALTYPFVCWEVPNCWGDHESTIQCYPVCATGTSGSHRPLQTDGFEHGGDHYHGYEENSRIKGWLWWLPNEPNFHEVIVVFSDFTRMRKVNRVFALHFQGPAESSLDLKSPRTELWRELGVEFLQLKTLPSDVPFDRIEPSYLKGVMDGLLLQRRRRLRTFLVEEKT